MAKPIGPLEPRFWSKVEKSTSDDCWFWKASIDINGYGQFGIRTGQFGAKKPTMMKAHRVVWLLTHGDIPSGMFLCHKCDMPRCVNPAHLFLGTQTDNMRDCVEKGRHGCGRVGSPIYYNIARLRKIFEAHRAGVPITDLTARYHISRTHLLRVLRRHKLPLRDHLTAQRKLTDVEIKQIRELYALGHISQRALADRFGVTQTNIGCIVRGASWPGHDGPLKTPRLKQKLTEDDAYQIRALYVSGQHTMPALAKRYGVSYSTIHYNINTRTLNPR